MFYIILYFVYSFSINPERGQAMIIIVEQKDVGIWKIITDKADKPLTDQEITE